MTAIPDEIKLRASRSFLAFFFARDQWGDRLRIDIGEPDEEGLYTPTITVHYDDNLLATVFGSIAGDKRKAIL